MPPPEPLTRRAGRVEGSEEPEGHSPPLPEVRGDRALHRAVRAACAALPDVALDDPGPWYPARRAALAEVVALIEGGASPNHRNSNGESAFDLAAGDPTCMNEMHAAHARFAQWNVRLSRKIAENRDAVGNTALHRAVKERNVSAAGDLLRLGAKMDVRNRYGITPFYMAVAAGDAAMAKVLIEGSPAGGFREVMLIACRNGDTPLHIAAREGRKDILRMLVRPVTDFSLAALETENADGATPAEVAETAGHDELAQWMRDDPREFGRRWGGWVAVPAAIGLLVIASWLGA